jgi:hypothetical protein
MGDLDRYTRFAITQSPDVFKEPVNRECRHASDPKRRAHSTGPPGLLDRALETGQQLAALVGEDQAGISQRNGAACSIEKTNTQLALELADRMGERRLRELEPLRRPTEMQLLADGKEIPEMTEVDNSRRHGSLSRGSARLYLQVSTLALATRQTRYG